MRANAHISTCTHKHTYAHASSHTRTYTQIYAQTYPYTQRDQYRGVNAPIKIDFSCFRDSKFHKYITRIFGNYDQAP